MPGTHIIEGKTYKRYKMQPAETCFTCPQVPAVSEELAYRFIQRLPGDKKWGTLLKALNWLTQRHEGLNLYEGINGRAYTTEEKDLIGAETGYVAATICPYFIQGGICSVDHLCSDPPNEIDRQRQRFYWLPTAVARILARNEYKSMVQGCLIADAKVAILTRPSGFYTREDVEEMRAPNVLHGKEYAEVYHI